jgi:AbrB family looped-hinge helix DNA binding protein
MQEYLSPISSKGQVTIPIEVRRALGLERGGKVSFVINDDGTVRLAVPRYPDVTSLAGAAGSLREQREWREVKEIAREEASRD